MKRPSFLILLITAVIIIAGVAFFMYTTTLSTPTTMTLYMPADEKTTDEYQDVSSKLTVVLLKNDRVYGYYGTDISDGRELELKDVRSLIQEALNKYPKDSLVVIIKAAEEATYKNTVDMLDEMTINDINRYTMNDLSKEEKEFLTKTDR